MSIRDTILGWVHGADGEEEPRLDWASLRGAIVRGIIALRGKDGCFPSVVDVTIGVQKGLDLVQRVLGEPQFDADIEESLTATVGEAASELPVRRYHLSQEAEEHVAVVASSQGAIAVVSVLGGIRGDLPTAEVSAESDCRIGRGAWHDEEAQLANDLVLPDDLRFVSQRAALLRRRGSFLEVEVQDQGEWLAVVRPNLKRELANKPRDRFSLRPGDVIELHDGVSKRVTLQVRHYLSGVG